MGDPEGSMTEVAPKNGPLDVPAEDEEDMTSIMSSDQRKQLQEATKEKEAASTLERDTAKPPPGPGADVEIPKAAPVPRIDPESPKAPSKRPSAEKLTTRAETPVAKASQGAPARTAQRTLPIWVILAFFLLAVAIAVALRPGG